MPSITTREEVEDWLDGKPREWAQLLAVRAALRVFPLVDPPEAQFELTLAVLRTLFISWAAAAWPTSKTRIAVSASYTNAVAVANAIGNALIGVADVAAGGHVAWPAADAAARAAATYLHVHQDAVAGAAANACAAAAAAGTAHLWSEIQHDVAELEMLEAPYNVLALRPLWRGTRELGGRWQAMKSTLRARRDEHWEPWIGWYERRLGGRSLVFAGLTARGNEDFCISLATESGAFWDRPVSFVNAEIEARLEQARLLRLGVADDEEAGEFIDEAPQIPASQPASLEPEWYGDVLGLTRQAASHDLGTYLPETLAALKDDLLELADDLVGDNRIGRQVQVFLKRLGERLPLDEPTQYQLHRIGVAESGLAGFVQCEEFREWPDFLASRLLSVQLQFDRVLGQFPSWRQFKRNAEHETLAPEEIKRIAESSERLAGALETEAADRIDSSVTEALRAQAEDLSADAEVGVLHSQVLRAIDAREGLRNTIKRLASRAVKEFGAEFSDEAGRLPKRAGKGAVHVFVFAVKAVVCVAAPVAMGMPLTEVLEFIRANPWVAIMIAGGDGWLKAALEMFAKQGKDKE